MNYRGVINMLMMCGCMGKSGGGWSHYVGREKLRRRPAGRRSRSRARLGAPAAPAEQHQFFYAHTDQWRYEKLTMGEVPVAVGRQGSVRRQHDRLQRARRA